MVATEACHCLAIGSVGHALRANSVKAFGHTLAVLVVIGSVLALFALCGLGVWFDANNPNGQNPAAVRKENVVLLGWVIGAYALFLLYLMLDEILQYKARAAIVDVTA